MKFMQLLGVVWKYKMNWEYDKIILEANAIEILSNSNIKQILNYLVASKCKLGLLVNFSEDSLKYKRVIL